MTRLVAHVSDSQLFGGTEQTILHLLDGLDRNRWRCVLLHAADAESRLVAAARAAGVEHHVSRPPAGLRELTLMPRLVRQIRALRPDVLHAHLSSPYACRFTLIAAALARVPAVVATAQLFMDMPSERAAKRHRIVVSAVNRYIAVSREVASKLRDVLGVPAEKIRIVHNGVVLDRFEAVSHGQLRDELTGRRTRAVVLTLARLDRQKGHRFLLEAAMQVPDAVFVLAGDGPERQALEHQAARCGLSGRVCFLGDRVDVPELLASCDLLLLPSLFEGLPLAALEGMAAGKPVVATLIGGTDEVVVHGETGLLVPPSDPNWLAAAIRTILHDPALAHRLGENGRIRVASRFSVEAMVGQVESVYDDVLG